MAKKKKTGMEEEQMPEELRQLNIHIACAILHTLGCTPEMYAAIYDEVGKMPVNPEEILMPTDLLMELFEARQRLGDLQPGMNPTDIFANAIRDALDEVKGADDNNGDADASDVNILRFAPGSGEAAKEAPDVDLAKAKATTLRLRIQLDDMKNPAIWREIEVSAAVTFLDLHYCIQRAMGWDNSHLHSFHTGSRREMVEIGTPDTEFGVEPDYDESSTTILAFLAKKGDKVKYEYDFGDGWEHTVTVKAVTEQPCEEMQITGSSGTNVIEDCGGTWGLENIYRIANGRGRLSEDDRNQLEWLGFSTRAGLKKWLYRAD